MNGLYENAVLPEPSTILGRTLKPFSFGHFLILRRFGVGFVSDLAVKPTLEDIVFSIFVCSHTYQECEQSIYSGKWVQKITEWKREVDSTCKRSIPKGGTIKDVFIDWQEKQALFQDYIDRHCVRPHFKPRSQDTDSGESNAEWYEGVLKILKSKCGYSHSEVMNLPFARAFYEYLSYLEQQGLITFYNERQEKQLKAILEKKKGKVNG